MNTILSYFFRRTQEGKDILARRFVDHKEKFQAFKSDFIPSAAGQRMVRDKLEELRHELMEINEIINKLKKESAETDDSNDFIYELFIEVWQKKLKKTKKYLWRFSNMLYVDGLQPTDRSEKFDVERIKSEVLIEQIMDRAPVRKDMDRDIYSCIFHNEHTPSMTVYKGQNKFYCFGCGKFGSCIDIYMELNSVDFITACKELNNLL